MLVPLQGAEARSCGGKAAVLRLLLERGLRIPAGVCLPVSAYQSALPDALPSAHGASDLSQLEDLCQPLFDHLQRWQPSAELLDALGRAARNLGWPVVVRSSASCEDQQGSLMPGIFCSVLGVDGVEALLQAIRRVWISLWSVPAWAILRRRQSWPGEQTMALIIQRQVPARQAGLALSHDPSDCSAIRVEAARGVGSGVGSGVASGALDPRWFLLPREAEMPPEALMPLEALAALRDGVLSAEDALAGPVEVEWVFDGRALWLVQARPASISSKRAAFPLEWRREEHRQARWRWDREHNPEPLSPSHASLVDALEQAAGPPRFMVQQGYLYCAVGPEEEAAPGPQSGDLASVWNTFRRQAEQRIQQLEACIDEIATLEPHIQFLSRFYASYFGTLSRARRAARQQLSEFLRREMGGVDAEQEAQLTVPATHATLERARQLYRLSRIEGEEVVLSSAMQDHLDRFGTLFSCWDVATPTLAEQPRLLANRLRSLSKVEADPGEKHRLQHAAATQLEQTLAAGVGLEQRRRFHTLLEQARLARSLEEDDDLLFSRALALLRRVLLQVGRDFASKGWIERAEDVFLLSLDQLQAVLNKGRPDEDLRAGCIRNREAWEETRKRVPPLFIEGEQLIYDAPPAEADAVLRGLGIGGAIRGQVRRVSRLDQMLQDDFTDAVVVCPTLLPALAVVLPEAAALVTDHGGLLSHAACLARELGKVAVVGTGSATSVLAEGEWVWVDGTRGMVVRVTPPSV